MKMSVASKNMVLMTDVVQSVVFETETGERLSVTMSKNGFDLGVSRSDSKEITWYEVNSKMEPKFTMVKCPKD